MNYTLTLTLVPVFALATYATGYILGFWLSQSMARARVADLKARIRRLCDEGDSERETYFAGYVDTTALRALVDDDTTRSEATP